MVPNPSRHTRSTATFLGFGGTNAHTIVESYQPPLEREHGLERCHSTAVSFMFSGYSERVLSSQLTTFLRHLDTAHDSELRELAWNLSGRSYFSLRTTVSGSDVETLRRKVQAKLQAKTSEGEAFGACPSNKSQKILGAFTGQERSGRSWALACWKSRVSHAIPSVSCKNHSPSYQLWIA